VIVPSWSDFGSVSSQGLSDTVDCCIPDVTEAIKPEEREELKVSGQYVGVSFWFQLRFGL